MKIIFVDIKNTLVSKNKINEKVRKKEKISFKDCDINFIKNLIKYVKQEQSIVYFLVEENDLFDIYEYKLNLGESFLFLIKEKDHKNLGHLIQKKINKSVFLKYEIFSKEDNSAFLPNQLTKLKDIKLLS